MHGAVLIEAHADEERALARARPEGELGEETRRRAPERACGVAHGVAFSKRRG